MTIKSKTLIDFGDDIVDEINDLKAKYSNYINCDTMTIKMEE